MLQYATNILTTARPAVPLLLVTAVAASAASTEKDLIRQLLQDYDPAVRPVLDPENPVNVTVSLGLKTFIALDMRSQTAVSFGWLKIVWTDELLTWDPADHNNVTTVHASREKVWCPDLVIFNTLTDINALNEQPTTVAIRHDGQVLWYPGGLFQTHCTVDITYYPFDTQVCSIDVITWSIPVQFLNGTFGDPVFDVLDVLENHPAWDLADTDSEYELRPAGYWVLKFTFMIQRKSLFYIINIILPMTLLSSLSSLVFILPAQSGEKMTVSVTSFLSLAVFVSFINEALPQNSDSLCFFSVYVMVQMFLSLCSTAVCALTVSLAHREQGGATVSPSHIHTASGLLPSQQPKSEPAPSVMTTSLPSQLRFQFPEHTSRCHHRTITVPAVVDKAASSQSFTMCRSCQNKQGTSLYSLSSEFSPSEYVKNHKNGVEYSEPYGSEARSSPRSGYSRGESVAQTQERQSPRNSCTHRRFLALLALRVDKVFLVIMLCANLVSCLVYTLSMTWATQHF